MSETSKEQGKKRKRPGYLPAKPFGTGQPVPKSPGRPRKDRTPPDPEIDPELPSKLGEARAAMEWTFEPGLPKHAGVRLFVLMLRRSPKEFYAELTRLERGWSNAGKSVEGIAVEAPGVEERLADPVGEKLEAMIGAWLDEVRAKVDAVCPCCGRKVEKRS